MTPQGSKSAERESLSFVFFIRQMIILERLPPGPSVVSVYGQQLPIDDLAKLNHACPRKTFVFQAKYI